MLPIKIPEFGSNNPTGKQALFLEKVIILGRLPSKNPSYGPSLKSVFEFQYMRHHKTGENGEKQPIRISRTWYGSRKLGAFLQDLTYDYPAARTKNGIDAASIIGRAYSVFIEENTKGDKIRADICKIVSSSDPIPFEKKGIVMLAAPVFFSIYQNVETGEAYKTAAEVVSSSSFLALSNWQKEAIGESLEFKDMPDAARYDLRRDSETGRVNIEPISGAIAAPEPEAADLPWGGAENESEKNDDLPF
jgi:hypothetical protein